MTGKYKVKKNILEPPSVMCFAALNSHQVFFQITKQKCKMYQGLWTDTSPSFMNSFLGPVKVACVPNVIKHRLVTVLSTLLDNLGDSRF